MKAITLENDLKTAKDELRALQAELPNFHSLLTDNEQDAARLKAERAPLDAQAQAKGRVNVARELLEQHQSDIQTAKVEVERLELIAARERTLSAMADAAKRGKHQRQVLESAMAAGNAALLKHVEKVDGAWRGMLEARGDFLKAGGTLSNAFNRTRDPLNASEEWSAALATGEAVLEELTAQGVDLQDVLRTAATEDRRASVFDRLHGRTLEVPQPFGPMVRGAVETYRKHKFNLNKDLPGGGNG